MIDERILINHIENWKQSLDTSYQEELVGTVLNIILKKIRSLPKIEKGEWIPCSERLPKKPIFPDEGYIVQQKNVREPFVLYWDGEKWQDADEIEEDDILAWMPLPEAYKPPVAAGGD